MSLKQSKVIMTDPELEMRNRPHQPMFETITEDEIINPKNTGANFISLRAHSSTIISVNRGSSWESKKFGLYKLRMAGRKCSRTSSGGIISSKIVINFSESIRCFKTLKLYILFNTKKSIWYNVDAT